MRRVADSRGHNYSFSNHQTSTDTPPSECGAAPDTEVGISINSNLEFVGRIGSSSPSSAKTAKSPVVGGPAGAWNGEWVEHTYVKESKYDISIGAMPRARGTPIGRVPAYQV